MEPFQVRIAVRGYELDPRGHVNQAVYLQYAEHARWEWLHAAGISHNGFDEAGIGPIVLKQTIRYIAELRGGDEVDITCSSRWETSKTFEIDQHFQRPDGSSVADVTVVGGLLDLDERQLVSDPSEQLRALASAPELLGL